MKTDKQKLSALIDYLELNKKMAYYRMWAETYFQVGDETTSWRMLLAWVEAKDERAALWRKFQKHYTDAIFLREGV